MGAQFEAREELDAIVPPASVMPDNTTHRGRRPCRYGQGRAHRQDAFAWTDMAKIDDDIPQLPSRRRRSDAFDTRVRRRRPDDRARGRRRGRRPRRRAARGPVALIRRSNASYQQARAGPHRRNHARAPRPAQPAQSTGDGLSRALRRATRDPLLRTSVMYAGEVGSPGVISTTFRGLLEGGTLSGRARRQRRSPQRPTHARIIFGDGATGKSTLLNSLFELVSWTTVRRRRARAGPAGTEGKVVLRPPRRRRQHRRAALFARTSAHGPRSPRDR